MRKVQIPQRFKNHITRRPCWPNAQYHYYAGVGARAAGDPVHSFSAEEALLYELAKDKRLKLCTYREV